ncbi:MAG: glycosyltransferase family 4 protein [Gemmatimonadota bacterium]|nr:glycosyltransferase family 4 protein [Gemmatimonadota bacterium]
MQRLSYHLIEEMRHRVQVTAVTWGGSQKFLPFFLPYALMRSLWEARRGIDLVSAGDPIVAVVGWIMKSIARVPIVAVAHGLDVTFGFRPYQWVITRVLRHLDRIVCISESARAACIARGVAIERCVIVYPGVSLPAALPSRSTARDRLAEVVGRPLDGMAILLTVGRLVPRKGVVWYLESVYAELAAQKGDVHYVIVGDGPEVDHVKAAATRLGLDGRVSVAGIISEDDLLHAYVGADLFVMPNVAVPGDMEGFGLVALEAAAHGLPVLAADLEGIRAAVVPGETGELVKSGHAGAWLEATRRHLDATDARRASSRVAREAVASRFGWARMADAYEAEFRNVLQSQPRSPTRHVRA